MEDEFGMAPDRLPITVAPTIRHGNALHVDWADLLPPSDDVIILGNPPFIGQYTKTPEQTRDAKAIWGKRYNGYLGYVTCWYAKSIDYFGESRGRWAFVSTNSICQGEPVEHLWRC
ncbi:DNA methyltransferase [Actinopolymorpha sp. B9G3]|uniref:DNA methyltransferase n=1 Tax=Actinopolymorpha sp. B9G3 TaxID=3158970 RepID=UPI0032D96286